MCIKCSQDPMSNERICNKCKKTQPIDEFVFARGERTHRCRECRREVQRKWREANREHVSAYNAAWKAANHDRVQMHRKTYYRKHKDRIRRYHREHYQEHKERYAERRRQYEEANKERLQAAKKAWVERNREHLKKYQANRRVKKREHLRQYRAAWLKANPEYRQVYKNHLRTAKGKHSIAEWRRLKEAYGYRCLCCGRKEPEIKLTQDHIIPVSRGGSNNIDNIQPLCKSCNASKRDQIIDYRPSVTQPLASL